MTKDIAEYERRAKAYLGTFANAAEKDANQNQTKSASLILPDTIEFWIRQVVY